MMYVRQAMRDERRRAPFGGVMVLAGGLFALCLMPQTVADRLSACAHDSLAPAYAAITWLRQWGAGQFARTDFSGAKSAADHAHDELEAWKLRCRQAELHVARLSDVLAQQRRIAEASGVAVTGQPLVEVELVKASVLGEETASLVRGGVLIGAGEAGGVLESALVLDSTQPLLDQGESSGIAGGEAVCAGRVVVGRIDRVGRWVSTLQRVTDPGFVDRVQVARATPEGLVFGPYGLLKGSGSDTCRLELVGDGSATAPVGVGDEVYTASRDSALPWRMYYGEVVEAEFDAGTSRWNITVEPAGGNVDLRTAHVVRPRMNPARMLAN